ncbi:MAG: hypothetical protein AAB224_06005 [Gemmatimonadota bacterium]
MTTRRGVRPLVLALVASLGVACSATTTELQSVPYGFLTFVAQKSTAGHTALPIGTFYNASGLGVPTSTAPWDSCRVQAYSAAPAVGLGSVFPSMNAGPSIQLKLPLRTDSLFPVASGSDMHYKPRSGGAIPYTPGDSVGVVIPGAGGEGGFPAISFRAKTAEAFAVQDFGVPAVGSRIDVRWNAAQDDNATMVFSFRYTTPGATVQGTQIYCQFRDDGADSIPTRFVGSWVSAAQKTWVASRVRTYVAPVAKGGYFDFISTYDIPTPPSP